jgi:hypothetical protein
MIVRQSLVRSVVVIWLVYSSFEYCPLLLGVRLSAFSFFPLDLFIFYSSLCVPWDCCLSTVLYCTALYCTVVQRKLVGVCKPLRQRRRVFSGWRSKVQADGRRGLVFFFWSSWYWFRKIVFYLITNIGRHQMLAAIHVVLSKIFLWR